MHTATLTIQQYGASGLNKYRNELLSGIRLGRPVRAASAAASFADGLARWDGLGEAG